MLVAGAGASQERLAQAAQSSVSTITKLADVVKLGAASLGSEDPETQVWMHFCLLLYWQIASTLCMFASYEKVQFLANILDHLP